MIRACPRLSAFLTGAILKGLILQNIVFDVYVCLFGFTSICFRTVFFFLDFREFVV